MKKKIMYGLLTSVLCFSFMVFAGAVDIQTDPIADSAIAATIENALQQPMDAEAHEQLLQNKALFEQVLTSEEVIYEDGEVQGTVRSYEFVPRYQTRATSYSYLMREHLTTNNPQLYARHYADFMYDYTGKVSCFENYVTTDIPSYVEKELSVSGNGTKKSTAKHKFYFSGIIGPSHWDLTIWCDYKGKNNA